MKTTSINQLVMGAGLALMLLFGVSTGAGLWVAFDLAHQLEEQTLSAKILQIHQEADMAHDALRGDVLLAFQSQTPGSSIPLSDVRRDLAEHVTGFNTAIKTNLELAKNPKLHATLTKVSGPLADYIQSAQAIIALVDSNPSAANASMQPFMVKFLALEKAMANASIEIQAEADADVKRADDKAGFAKLLMLAALMVGLSSCALLIFATRRQVVQPLVNITRTVERLAKGDFAVTIPASTRSDELGLLTRALHTFKQAISDRASEAEAAEQRRMLEEERRVNEERRLAAEREQTQMVEAIASGLDRLSNGDLTAQLNEPFAPEYERLRTDFNAAILRLRQTVVAVIDTTSSMRTGTEEISRASDDLSRRTEQQAASLEQTAAALDEITATVRKTAEGSNEASQVVSKAAIEAQQGGDVVRRAVEAMSQIESSASQISQIIGVIDEIAFQTNLLALNAGVEAARAGDAGRGFAVVASEVRALAQRSAEAAKEIKALISASSRQVGQGVELVGQTGNALTRIVEMVSGINALVVEIAASAKEQATGLHEVNSAVNQMDQVTQQNAAMVEQTTAASHSLAAESSDLVRLISHFNVGESGRSSAPVARPASRPAPRPSTQTHFAFASSRGSAAVARRPAPVAQDENWEEF
jgi:methyl-accepting chemotaxis protein